VQGPEADVEAPARLLERRVTGPVKEIAEDVIVHGVVGLEVPLLVAEPMLADVVALVARGRRLLPVRCVPDDPLKKGARHSSDHT